MNTPSSTNLTSKPKLTQAGLDEIKLSEGLRLSPYLDAVNVPTIGYGNTFYEDGTRVKITDKPITKERAEQLLLNTLKRFAAQIYPMIKVPVSNNEFSALLSFVYNVGPANFQSSTLLRKLNDGDRVGAAQQFSRWNKAGGKVLPGLVARRFREEKLFTTPDSPTEKTYELFS
jgi:lysozyme